MDIEKLLTREQKEEVIRSAILKAAEGELSEGDFDVRYDRRFSLIFRASRHTSDERVDVCFSISPVSGPPTFFQNAASEAARAILDIRDNRLDAVTQPRPSEVTIHCPECGTRHRILES